MTDQPTDQPVDTVTEVPVAIVGAGPAGLMLAHRLGLAGVDTVAIDIRSREEIETTQRAGILEAQAARDLIDLGVSDRILRDGYEHQGVELRFGGQGHRIDFQAHVGSRRGSTRRPTSSSTWPTLGPATVARSTSASAARR